MDPIKLLEIGLTSGVIIKLLDRAFDLIDRKRGKKTVSREEYNALEKRLETFGRGLMRIQQHILMNAMDRYLEQGYITKWQRQNLDGLMESYEENGGDEFIHDQYELCRELPSTGK